MALAEPTPESLPSPFLRYFLATRPPFLSVTLTGGLIGMATAGGGDPLKVSLALLGALLIHAGINVLNDVYDARNGTDARNTERLFPFTGGSRFIQNGVLTERAMLRLGLFLLACGSLLGLSLVPERPGLLLIGGAGLFLGWAYSAPPWFLAGRGLGEAAVAAGFGILIPLGMDYVARGSLSWLPVIAGLPYGLLVADVLYINQFPDRKADEAAGKRHLVVRLGPLRARYGYGLIALAAYLWLSSFALWGPLPATALLALLAAPVSFLAAGLLWRHALAPPRLLPAIQLTLAAALAFGLLLALGLW
ncbi:MAG: prenyltransferase, partial [Gammaproteobacteria bacterium]